MYDVDIYGQVTSLDGLRLRDLAGNDILGLLEDFGALGQDTLRTSPVLLSETARGDRVVAYPNGLALGEQPILPWG